MNRACIIGIVVVLVLGAAQSAHAGEEPETDAGRRWFTTGSEAFERGDFAAAADAFKRGYDEEPWSGFLFAWAQAERSGGSCPAAIELYSRFIATEPPAEAKQHALGWIEVCGGKYTPPKPRPQDPPPESAPPPPVAPPQPAIEPAPRDEGPGFRHKLALGLATASVASAVIAVRCYSWSQRDAEASLVESRTYADKALRFDRAERRLVIARVSGGLALGLAVAATLRVVLQREPAASVDVAISPHGELLVTGSF